MLSQIQKPLLSIIRESPDFEAAYDPLIGMALRLHAVNPEAAKKLLLELELANPDRQEARLIHKHLSNQ
jgi:spermidine synthase